MRHDRHFVDELAQRMGEGIGRMFRITAITANPDQPRSTLGDLSDLMASIQRHGVLEPLLVRRRADGLYQLVAGERLVPPADEPRGGRGRDLATAGSFPSSCSRHGAVPRLAQARMRVFEGS
jgi:hypothetical protein